MKIIFALLFVSILQVSMIDREPRKTSLQYIVRLPKIKSENPPLLILMHGLRSDEKDLFSFADQLPDKFLVISARAPIKLGEGSYAWYNMDRVNGKIIINAQEAESSRTMIIQFIQDLMREHRFDLRQVYLCGFSQGAIMSYSVALTRPDLIHGIAVMSGRLLDEVKPLIVSKEKLQPLKIFISHGTNDQMLKIDDTRKSVAYLKTLNLNPVYSEYAAGHEINKAMLKDLIDWLNKY